MIFLSVGKIHEYETRQNIVPQIPKVKGPGYSTFAYNASKHWQTLPVIVKNHKKPYFFQI